MFIEIYTCQLIHLGLHIIFLYSWKLEDVFGYLENKTFSSSTTRKCTYQSEAALLENWVIQWYVGGVSLKARDIHVSSETIIGSVNSVFILSLSVTGGATLIWLYDSCIVILPQEFTVKWNQRIQFTTKKITLCFLKTKHLLIWQNSAYEAMLRCFP